MGRFPGTLNNEAATLRLYLYAVRSGLLDRIMLKCEAQGPIYVEGIW
ncbi:MAG: hypothetical protein ACJAVO_001864 [Parvibaculaceae bacterium]|mgnify:CR=1 FL=1|jgi:hypothetical protein